MLSEPSADNPEPGTNPAETASGDATFAWLYGELRALAQSELAGERRGHTLSATALVNEVFLKLKGPGSAASTPTLLRTPGGSGVDRARFFALAAQAMRRILVDHARTRGRRKRGGGWVRVTAETADAGARHDRPGLDTLALDEALTLLTVEHPDAAQVVELRFFAGLSEVMIAEALGVTERTVRRHWTFAKAWLARELGEGPG